VRLLVCGVRGSTPAPGPEFVRYGGNTSCIAVLADEDERPRLVLDAGTGLARLSKSFGGEAFVGTILLGHLHWDHTHGLPFFPAGYHPSAEVTLLLPEQGEDAEDLLGRAFSPPHFPIWPRQLGDGWTFDSLKDGEHEIEGFQVLVLEIPHKGGRTFGYRISDGAASFAYLSDHSPIAYGPGPDGFGPYHEAAVALASGVDLLIHDAQHTAAEFPSKSFMGHSAIDYPVGLAREAGAKGVLLFHHDPPRTDDEIDAIVELFRGGAVPVDAAAEGAVITL
jgi:phosphoribosyl 1,2-cyclic phosphodiesterase